MAFGAKLLGVTLSLGCAMSAWAVGEGDLVISEIMQNPSAVFDSAGEWFEVYNATASPIEMQGLVFSDNSSNTFTVESSLIVAAGDFVVFGVNGDTGTNGGVPVDYVWTSAFQLSNGDDEIILVDGPTEVDRVEYDDGAGWPDPNGASMFLLDLNSDNNVNTSWGTSTQPYGDGDLGTPGFAPSTAPSITGVTQTPVAPTPSDDVFVTAEVADNGTLDNVDLVYTVDSGTPVVLDMTISAARVQYEAEIPMQPEGSMVEYYIEATDNDMETSTSATFSYTSESLSCGDIAADMRVQDADEVPVNLYSVQQLCGIVTVAHEFGDPGPGYLQTSSGAMAFYSELFTNAECAIGDSVVMVGELDFYNGLTELYPTGSFTVISSGNPVPAPTVITPAEFNEANEAYLISVENVEFLTPGVQDVSSSQNFLATVGVDTITVRIDSDLGDEMSQFILPSGPTTVTGVLGQFDFSAPHTEGYQLLPRFQADVPVGGGNLPPAISNLMHSPDFPSNTDPVTVSVDAVDSDGTVTGVELNYTVDAGSLNTLAMSAMGDTWSAVIAPQAEGAMVEYYVVATDDDMDSSTSSTLSYTVSAPLSCIDISEVAADNADGLSPLNGEIRMICGTVLAGAVFNAGGPIYMMDETGATCVFGGDVYDLDLQPGDVIEATGEVTHYNGLSQLSSSPTISVISTGNPAPTPEPLAASTFNDSLAIEAMEAHLVVISEVTFPETGQVTITGSGNDYLCDADGVQIVVRIDRDLAYDIDGTPDQFILPAGTVDLVGLVSQFDSSAPHYSGYQLLPRDQFDVTGPTELDPTVLSISVNSNDIELSWTAVDGATNYNVYRSADAYSGFVMVGSTATLGYTDAGALGTGPWFYWVEATN